MAICCVLSLYQGIKQTRAQSRHHRLTSHVSLLEVSPQVEFAKRLHAVLYSHRCLLSVTSDATYQTVCQMPAHYVACFQHVAAGKTCKATFLRDVVHVLNGQGHGKFVVRFETSMEGASSRRGYTLTDLYPVGASWTPRYFSRAKAEKPHRTAFRQMLWRLSLALLTQLLHSFHMADPDIVRPLNSQRRHAHLLQCGRPTKEGMKEQFIRIEYLLCLKHTKVSYSAPWSSSLLVASLPRL